MGIITVSLDDETEKALRILAAKKGKKKGALAETIAELTELTRSKYVEELLERIEKGFPINAGKIRREDIYAERA